MHRERSKKAFVWLLRVVLCAGLLALGACAGQVEERLQPSCEGTHDVPKARGDGDLGVLHQGLVDCTKRTDTGYVSGKAFTITVVTVDGKPVEIATANAYWVMQEAARKAGVAIRIVSGFRTMAEQQYLYNCYLTKRCNNGNLAARPGYSNHQSGHALDLNTSSSGVYNWLANNAGRFGFKRTVPSENWHWEWWGGGPGGGPCQSTCKPRCASKSKIIGKDCGEGDCAAFGAVCTDDRLGVRCTSVFCPALGSKKVCVKSDVGTCTDGALKLTKCGAGKTCKASPSPHCVGAAPPRGYLDSASCTQLKGWAQDQDAPDKAIQVHLYFGGPAGAQGAVGSSITADVYRDDLCSAIGSCKHGFLLDPPLSLLDGKEHAVHAYGIDVEGISNKQLSSSPKTLKCKASIPGGIRRHVMNMTSFKAWKLDFFWNVMTLADAQVQAIPEGAVLAASPLLVRAGEAARVWVVDGPWRRAVASPDVMARWKFDFADVQKWTAEKVNALYEGNKWPDRPFFVRDSKGAVYMLDDPPPPAPTGEQPVQEQPASEPVGAVEPVGTDAAGSRDAGQDAGGMPEPATEGGLWVLDGSVHNDGAVVLGGGDAGGSESLSVRASGCGCAVVGVRPAPSGGLVVLVGLLLLVSLRRRRF